MENSYSRLSKSQSFSRNASNHDIKNSLKDIQNEYTKALEQIEDLKSERSYLKAALNRSTDEKQNKSIKEESISVNQVSQTMKSSYANKALIESERRVLELEEENKKLKKLVKSHGKKFLKMQEEILAYQHQVDKLGYLKVYNQDLQAEMELLDQEFQAIIKRVEGIDDEKSQSQINQSLSVKNSKEFKQVLLKYSNYIIRTVNSLDTKNPVRFRYEEVFPSDSALLNLIVSKDYSTLILKAMKLIADIIPISNTDNIDQEESLHRLSPFSNGEVTPQKISAFNTLNDQIFNQIPELSLHNSIVLPNSLTRGGIQSPHVRDPGSSQIRSQLKSPVNTQPGQAGTETKKPRETQSSLSFGTRESKPQSLDMKAGDSPKSLRSQRSQQDFTQRLDVSPVERPTHNFPDIRVPTNTSASPYIREELYDSRAAELELIQREQELIERERELMEKKKEYLLRSRELNEKDYSMSEQRSIRENGRGDMSGDHGRIKSQRRVQPEADDSTLRIREEEEFEQHRRSPVQLKSILKSSSSQVIENLDKEKDSVIQRRREDETLSIGSAGHARSAKDMSNVLREKTKHIARVLTKGSLYEDDLHSIKSEQEMSVNRSRDKSPANSYKNFEEADTLKASKMRSAENRSFQDEFESRFGSNDSSLVGDKKGWFYPKSLQNQSLNNQSKNNSNMPSYHPIGSHRIDSNESKKDENSNKKVSFYAQYHKSTGSENQESGSSQQQSRTPQTPDQEGQQEIYNYSAPRRFNDIPRGTQYASFSVAFGRTESAERDPSSPVKHLGSIIDVYMKKRVDHTYQTYDVVKGEESYKRAVRESGSPQYKVLADSQNSSRRAKRCLFSSEDYATMAGKPTN